MGKEGVSGPKLFPQSPVSEAHVAVYGAPGQAAGAPNVDGQPHGGLRSVGDLRGLGGGCMTTGGGVLGDSEPPLSFSLQPCSLVAKAYASNTCQITAKSLPPPQ